MSFPADLIPQDLIARVLDEARQLLLSPGVRVSDPEALQLLKTAGAVIHDDVVQIPASLVESSISTVPHFFDLYDYAGKPAVHYGGDTVQFDPGSCAPHFLDLETGEHRNASSADLIDIIKVTEMLPQFAAQSTAVVCHDAPAESGDLHRLQLVLEYSNKPVVTGAFSPQGIRPMIDLLTSHAGSADTLRAKPRAIFDVCPSPPLHWTDFACRCLIELGRAGIPVEMVSMPLAGATAPVTLIGSITQHTAESLAGIVIHQLAAPGAPIVWGGAPAIFDMRTGAAPMGAIETAMICSAYARVGKSLGLPTHAYLCASDSKTLDAQAGMESGMTALVGALSGINMISGAGMLDFLNCFSLEKLVLDAEAIAITRRLLQGIDTPQPTLALETFAQVGLSADFLKLKETRQLFQTEQYLPPPLIDRTSLRAWQEAGSPDAYKRAKARVQDLIMQYNKPLR